MASLRKNVASQNISFVLVNATTGAALTGATFTSKAWVAKDGAQAGFGGTFTELGNGQYNYAPTQAETNCTSFGLAINPTSSIPVNLQMFTDNWDTTASIASVIWQDATAGDFTTASSIGKSLYTTGATPGATGGLFIAGTNAATTVTTSLTTTFTGNLTGSVASVTGAVGSVTGAVGSVTGNVGGNVTGSVGSVVGAVGSVTGAVGSVTGNVGGNVIGTVASVVGAVGSVAGNVGGNVVGSVGSVTAAVTVGTINAAASNIKKNTIIDISFPMTNSTTHLLATGLTVTATRSIDGAAFGACANAVAEIGTTGVYNITLAATDTNGNAIMYKFTATGADDRLMEIITQP